MLLRVISNCSICSGVLKNLLASFYINCNSFQLCKHQLNQRANSLNKLEVYRAHRVQVRIVALRYNKVWDEFPLEFINELFKSTPNTYEVIIKADD